jgi:hypothetical protein
VQARKRDSITIPQRGVLARDGCAILGIDVERPAPSQLARVIVVPFTDTW